MASLQDYYNTNDDNKRTIYGVNWAGQTFTTSTRYSISHVKLLLYRIGSPGTCYISIRATSGGVATGSDLTVGTIDGNSVTTSTAGLWYEIIFPNYTLSASTQYAIVVRAPNGFAENIFYWRIDATTPTYTGGALITSGDSGGSWSSASSTDCMFETYGGLVEDLRYRKKLVAIGNQEVWYEQSAGTMIELTAANGTIDCANPLTAVEAFGKIFIANGTNLKIADFVNIKITTADIKPVNKVIPLNGTVLTGGTSGAKMTVDYIDASDGSCNVYGLRTTTATFSSGESVTGTVTTTNDVTFTTSAAEIAPPHWYSWTVYSNDTTTYGTMPSKAYNVFLYRGRLGLVNLPYEPEQWYLSRQFNPWDFYMLNSTSDAQRAIMGGTGDAGTASDIILCGIPYSDDYCVLGCVNEIEYMSGDPADGGSMNNLQQLSGILSSTAWCWDESSNLYILTSDGLVRIPIGFAAAENLTAINYPDFIKDLAYDVSAERIILIYDREKTGIIITKTNPSTGINAGYWYDLKTQGLFPESYPVNYSIMSSHQYEATNLSYRKLVAGCTDGYIRYFDPAEQDDNEDTAIDSYTCFGPYPVADGYKEGTISNIKAITGGGATGGTHTDSNNLSYKVFVGDTAEEVMEKMDANTAPTLAGTFYASGKNGVKDSRKIRGIWFGIRLGNSNIGETWSFEKLHIGE